MKKKILLLSTFIIATLVILCTGNKKEVKAEGENCQVYYNYYLFLDASNSDNLHNLKGNDEELSRTTEKDFRLGLPENVTNEDIVSSGMLELDATDSLPKDICGKTSWNLEEFYNKFKEIGSGTGEQQYSNKLVPQNGIEGVCSYARAYAWRESGQSYTGAASTTNNYDEFKTLVPLGMGHPVINGTTGVETGRTGIKSKSSFVIERTWNTNELPEQGANKTLRSPAVYYVSYKLCDDVTTPTYTLTVEHLLDGTTNKLKDNHTKTGYKTGDKDTYNCPAISGYTVVNSTNQPSEINVEFENANITKQCYYTENTYTLTINYGSDENCSKTIANPTTYDGLKAGDVKTHEIKSTIGELADPTLGTVSNAFNTKPSLNNNKISVTMPAKNVEVCVVYTPKTGSSWIYLVWVIGGLSLGYSIWYFVRYYKKQNSEI